MSDVFISYANEDREQAKALAQALEQEGIAVWWDRKIPFGKDFDTVIEKALSEAKCVLVLWTQSSVQSRWVRAEASEAAAREVMLPVLLERDVKIPLEFRALQAADLRDWQTERQHTEFQALLSHARQMLAQPGAREARHGSNIDTAPLGEDRTTRPELPRTGSRRALHAPRRRAIGHLVAYILIPSVLLGAAVLLAATWRVPTELQLDLTTERMSFTLAGERAVELPVRPLNFATLSIENFDRIAFNAERFSINGAAGIEPRRRVISGEMVLNAGGGRRSLLVLDAASGDRSSETVGRLQSIVAQPQATATLESRSGALPGLMLRLEGQPLDTQILPVGRFALSASPVTIAGDLVKEPGSVSMRIVLPEHSPHLGIRGARRDFVITAVHRAPSAIQLLRSAPISAISFLKANASGVPVSALAGDGEIRYPRHSHIQRGAIAQDDVVELQDISHASISDVTLKPGGRGMELRFEGVVHAGHLWSAGVKRDLRVSAFSTLWQQWQAVALLVVAAWALSVLVGAFRLYRDFVPG